MAFYQQSWLHCATLLSFCFLLSVLASTVSAQNDPDGALRLLKKYYDVEEGSALVFNISKCEHTFCSGNNPDSPYITYSFNSSAADATGNTTSAWYLSENQAVIVFGRTPPQSRYFGYTNYLFKRNSKVLFDSVDDTLNNFEVAVGKCYQSKAPYNCDVTLVHTASKSVAKNITKLLVASRKIAASSINILPFPGQLLNLGNDRGSDQLGVLARVAYFNNDSEKSQYLKDPPLQVYKLTAKEKNFSTSLFPYPGFRPYVDCPTEDYLNSTFQDLNSAVFSWISSAVEDFSLKATPLVSSGIPVHQLTVYAGKCSSVCTSFSRHPLCDHSMPQY